MIEEKNKDLLSSLSLIFLLCVVCLWWAKNTKGFHLDPMIYTAVSKNLSNDHRYFNLTLSKTLFPVFREHPPFFFWIQSLIFDFFKILKIPLSGFIARLLPLLSSTGTVVSVFFIVFFLSDIKFATASSILLLLSPQFLKYGTDPFIESFLTFLSSLTILTFILAEKKSPKWLLLTGLFSGFAAITKGPVFLFIPFTVLFYSICYRIDLKKFLPWILPSFVFFLIPLALWIIPDILINKGEWLLFFIKKQIIYSSAGRGITRVNPFKYIYVLLIYHPHILILSIVSLYTAIKNKKIPSFVTLGLIWSLSVILPFSIMKWKLEHYIHPSYPAISMVAGYSVSFLKEETFLKLRASLKRLVVIIISLLLILYPIKQEDRLKSFFPILTYLKGLKGTDFELSIIRKKDPPWQETAFFKTWLDKDLIIYSNLESATSNLKSEYKFIIINTEELKKEEKIIKKTKTTLILRSGDYSLLFIGDKDYLPYLNFD